MEMLRNAIRDKVEAEARGIIRDAEEKAQARLEQARAEHRARSEAQARRLLVEADAEASRILAQAAIRARQEVLAAKVEVIDGIVAQVKKSLADTSTSDESMASLVRDGVRTLGGGKVRLFVSPKDRDIAMRLLEQDKELKENVLGVREHGSLGGVIVEDAGGRNRVDNTFDSRLEMLLARSLPEIGRALS